MGKTLLVLTGPTAVGKTALALRLATHFGCPILGADSRQMFRDLPIGTAAPTAEEQALVRHYFVGTLPLDADYNAARYEREALTLLDELFQHHETIVCSGGSQLYIDALVRGIDEMPDVRPDVRTAVVKQLHEEGLASLLEELQRLDPAYYEVVDRRNTSRIQHAVEMCRQTGRPFSALRRGKVKERPFRIVKVALNLPREQLFERINRRTDLMMEAGWLDEVKRALPYRHCRALNTVGYKELLQYLDGAWPLPFALERIRKNTRVYAKKQLTWLRRDDSVRWVDAQDIGQAELTIRQLL